MEGIIAHLGSGGGVFRITGHSPRSTRHMEIVRRFLELGIHVKQDGLDDRLAWIG